MNFSKRQLEIIEAATVLIGRKGIQNLTTKNLAKEMNFSEPALYRHFEGKTQILESVLGHYKNVLKEGLLNVMSSNETGLEKINGIIDFQFNHFTKYPAVIMVIFAETSFQYDMALSQIVSEILEQKKTMVTEIIEFGQKEGDIRKDIVAEQLATTVMGSMRFTILRWRLSNFKFDLINEGKELFKTLKLLIKQN